MTRQIVLSEDTIVQLLTDILEVNREIGKGGVACDISNRTYPAIQRAMTTLRVHLTGVEVSNQARLGAYVTEFAKKCGWTPYTSEGAFEYVQRISYSQGIADGLIRRYEESLQSHLQSDLPLDSGGAVSDTVL